MSSERKLTPDLYPLVAAALTDLVFRLQRADTKAIYKHLDVPTAMASLAREEHAYIVDDAYLVVYEVGTPWFTRNGVTILAEKLVLKIAVSGDFHAIPAFLERRAREAGCQLVMAGTALAKHDAALASLYHHSGFVTEAMTITKEL